VAADAVNVIVPDPAKVTLLYVAVPDENVAVAPDNVIVLVPDVAVRFVTVATFQTVPVPVSVITLDPKDHERVFAEDDANSPHEHV
jgi:hypothetical protein